MWMLIAIIIVGVIAACVLAALKNQPAGGGELSFEQRNPLFSPAERSFYGVLEQAVGSGYRVFGKVRLGDIVRPGKGLNKSRRTTALNKLNQKHLDFVVCTASGWRGGTGRPVPRAAGSCQPGCLRRWCPGRGEDTRCPLLGQEGVCVAGSQGKDYRDLQDCACTSGGDADP